MRLSALYGAITVLLLLVETSIALWLHDDFVRPYIGDMLTTPLVYCTVLTVYAGKTRRVVAFAFALACFVELLQSIDIIGRLQISNPVVRVILGSTFEWRDIVAYAAGALVVMWLERWHHSTSR